MSQDQFHYLHGHTNAQLEEVLQKIEKITARGVPLSRHNTQLKQRCLKVLNDRAAEEAPSTQLLTAEKEYIRLKEVEWAHRIKMQQNALRIENIRLEDAKRKADMVNHPPHYTEHPSGIECIEITRHMSFNLGNVVKYVWRADLKNGIEDLEKAQFYIKDEIAKFKKEQSNGNNSKTK